MSDPVPTTLINEKLKHSQVLLSENFNKFCHPARIYISGPTLSGTNFVIYHYISIYDLYILGKSYFIKDLLRNRDSQFNVKFDRVI